MSVLEPERPAAAGTLSIDGSEPLRLLRPGSVAELGDIVRRAAKLGEAIYPIGGGTQLGFGSPPKRPGSAVDLRGLDAVIDYPARDMTVTVQAGMTIARLQEILAAENQRLPVDVPLPERATLGGAIATNTSGPRRYGAGTFRDYVIGVGVINDRGEEVKAGGRVVKNVAGYDLCKLYVGSLGTLGVITHVTLKLRPRPEETALVSLPCPAERIETLLEVLHRSTTRPISIDLLNAGKATAFNREYGLSIPESWALIVGFEDNRSSVAWQIDQLIKEVNAEVAVRGETHTGDAATPLWRALIDFPARASTVVFQANVVPTATAAFCLQAERLLPGVEIQAHAGSGIIKGLVAPGIELHEFQAALAALLETAPAAQGNIVLRSCPAEWKPSLPVWGRPRPDAWLMREIKQRLDPQNLFNPGRFVDGI